MKPIKIKVDVTQIDKSRLFRAQSGKVYLDLVAWPNKNGPGQYGDTHIIKQDMGKDYDGQAAPIIGNLTLPEEEHAPAPPARTTTLTTTRPKDDGDEIPF